MQWRQPPNRVNHLRGDVVEFGRGRSRGSGYLAHSDRVGPSVLLLEASGHARAERFNAEGFTVLVPEVELDATEAIAAAADYLSANWHPRLGVIAVGPVATRSARLLLERDLSFDALVLYGDLWVGPPLPSMPLLAHLPSTFDRELLERFRAELLDRGHDPELYVYPEAAEDLDASDPAELADGRTLEMLEYFLS
jgi:hypothetical protein